MDEIKATSIIKQTLPMLVLMGLGGTLAGLLLNAARTSLDLFPGLLVLVPAMQNLRGSISGSLASRLSTALHQGTVRPAFRDNPELPMYALASISLSIAMSLIIGMVSYLFCLLWNIHSLGPLGMVGVSVTVGALSGFVHLLVNLAVSITSFRMGLDPDNIAIPVLTILGDIVTILYFLMIVRVVT
jgi:mgtE-like transporter